MDPMNAIAGARGVPAEGHRPIRLAGSLLSGGVCEVSGVSILMSWKAGQPNVKANVSTPASRNSISNCRSTIGFGCRSS